MASGRLIPAHAGKTGRWRSRSGVWTAHPRSRGENPLTVAVMVAMPGSSPLTRGKLCRTLERVSDGGLIPAHAGKTCRTFSTCSSLPAHPRSRGENYPHHHPWTRRRGSSPLTRGKRQAVDPAGHARGLIPAHAGKTHGTSSYQSYAAAHPRSRGENLPSETIFRNSSGSSPLTRGKLLERGCNPARAGLIPAHAGKTELHGNETTDCEAHPRSRGEN